MLYLQLRPARKNYITKILQQQDTGSWKCDQAMCSAAVWLSVNHLTSEPFKIGTKDSREKSMAASSLQVELWEHSEGSQSL